MNDSIVAQNEKFAEDFPREYQTWAMTEDTTFKSLYNGSQEKDVLEMCPEIVIIWTDMPSRANTIRRADIGIVLKTCGRFCVREVQA